MRSVRGKTSCLVLCTCLLTLAFLVRQAQAFTLGCEEVWKRPDATNDLLDCILDGERIKGHWMYYIYPGFAALFLVLLLAMFPIIFCNCISNGCCCRNCCFPTSAAQHYNGPCCLYFSSFIGLIWGLCAAFTIIMGANVMHNGVHASLHNLRNKTAQHFNETGNQVINYVTDGEAATDVPPSFFADAQGIFNITAKFLNTSDEAERDYIKYVDAAAIVSYSIGWLPFVLLFFTIPFAACRITRGVPACCSCVFFLTALVFSLLSIIFLVAAYLGSAANGEMNRQIAREPGMLQFYIVPYIDTEFQPSIARVLDELVGVVEKRVPAACSEINEHCDRTADFASRKPFFCNEPVVCRTANDLLRLSRTMPVKDPSMCLPGPSDAPSDTACTIAFCATNCDANSEDETRAMVYEASVKVMEKVGSAFNATVAYNLVNPLTNSNMIVDTLLWSTESFPDIREGLWMAGTGYFVGILVLVLGIYIMLRGRTVWGEYVDRRKGT